METEYFEFQLPSARASFYLVPTNKVNLQTNTHWHGEMLELAVKLSLEVTMTKKHYKNLSLTFLFIILWMVYVFFDYFTETEGFIKLTLFFDYYTAVIINCILAVIAIILRFTRFRKKDTEIFKDNFFYIFPAFASLFLIVVWFIYLLITKQIISETLFCLKPACLIINSNLIFGTFILGDIYGVKLLKPNL